jgi:hypothetical protein
MFEQGKDFEPTEISYQKRIVDQLYQKLCSEGKHSPAVGYQ